MADWRRRNTENARAKEVVSFDRLNIRGNSESLEWLPALSFLAA